MKELRRWRGVVRGFLIDFGVCCCCHHDAWKAFEREGGPSNEEPRLQFYYRIAGSERRLHARIPRSISASVSRTTVGREAASSSSSAIHHHYILTWCKNKSDFTVRHNPHRWRSLSPKPLAGKKAFCSFGQVINGKSFLSWILRSQAYANQMFFFFLNF